MLLRVLCASGDQKIAGRVIRIGSKYGDVELGKMRKEVAALKEDAATVVRQSKEALAMQIWNAGRWGSSVEGQEEVATKMLEDIYGEKARDYRYYLQHKGILKTPKSELDRVPAIKNPPRGTEESFFRQYRLDKSDISEEPTGKSQQ